jgi:pSer/pThr/pTyr-binding forkhead associated (FHA) protein
MQLTLSRRPSIFKMFGDEKKQPQPSNVIPLRLVLSAEGNSSISIPLAPRLTIGTDSRLDIDMPGGEQYRISDRHAVFTYHHNSLFIEDLDSAGGTRINGYDIDAGKQYPLRNGDELELGSLCLTVRLVRGQG